MIIVDVHQRDVFVDIEAHRVRDPEDFEWQKQARCYWNFDDDVAQVSIADVDFPYTNEYLGVKERLCITPLTDRCYVTLSQALGMFLGGAPAGPAGTGKTETTKDMGCTLGNSSWSPTAATRWTSARSAASTRAPRWPALVVLRRVQPHQPRRALGRGAAGRLRAHGVQDGRQDVPVHRRPDVNCDPRVGYFITMNPGYGRQELPENLKSQVSGPPLRSRPLPSNLSFAVVTRTLCCSPRLAAPWRDDDGARPADHHAGQADRRGYEQNASAPRSSTCSTRFASSSSQAGALRLRPAQHPGGAAHVRLVQARLPARTGARSSRCS